MPRSARKRNPETPDHQDIKTLRPSSFKATDLGFYQHYKIVT